MEARRAFAMVMILSGLLLAPFAVLDDVGVGWDFDDDWHNDHFVRSERIIQIELPDLPDMPDTPEAPSN